MEMFVSMNSPVSRRTILAIVFFSVAGIGCSGDKDSFSLSRATQRPWQILQLLTARQLVSSITASYESSVALVLLFERDDYHAAWRAVSEPMAAVPGRAGLAWEIGLHGDAPAGAPSKREGDGKAPAGVFILKELFGSESPDALGQLNLRYRQMTKFHYGVDDPGSRFYNKIVDVKKVTRDWTSAEKGAAAFPIEAD
jgi:L,D-peptidoglycan transpeptidase YkuD (ErfK/YbiS/YcfS/YnhG family)